MTAAGDGRFARTTFAVAALALGAPTVVFGGWLASVGLFYGLAGAMSGDAGSLLLMLWGLAGLVGVIAALTLSVSYVHGGRASLRRRAWPWWPALLAGMAAASVWLPASLPLRDGEWIALAAGPLLLPVALALLVLRGSARGAFTAPPSPPVPGPRSPVPP
ncbi:MAG: hypothetical protein KF823_07505 [Xanthomonadales bacterium]|nr:hypothetical protein [Xanthomonadales bacterium]